MKTILSASVITVFLAGAAGAAEYPIMEKVASKVIQKYQQSSCQQLWQEKMQKGQPMPEMEQRALKVLRGDPQMRQAFIDRVAGPIVNKMFECGMIP